MVGIQKVFIAVSTALQGLGDRQSDRGATAVEYGLIVALIAAVIVGVVGILGGQVNSAFQTVSNAMP